MTKILVYSIVLTEERKNELKRIFGEEIALRTSRRKLENWQDVVEEGADCDVFALAVGSSIFASLTNKKNNRKLVIRVNKEKNRWERVTGFKVETEIL